MKKIFLVIFTVVFPFLFNACTEDRAEYDEYSNEAQTGGLLDVTSSLVSYVVGEQGPYNVTFKVNPSKIATTKVDVYVYYNRSTDGAVSNKKLLKTVTINGQVNTFTVSFNELVSGLSIAGVALPTDDGLLNIGDAFILSYVSHLDNGQAHANVATTKLSVGTRFAGKYKCIDAKYYRIGVLTYTTANWPAETIIESVDATTYKVNEYLGAFNGNTWYFKIVGTTISYPALTPDGAPQTGNGQPFITCETNPTDMAIVNCGNTNFVTLDNVAGKDRLTMSFGYYTPGSGPRVFYQVMEKIVE